jgi:hypothetical protein
MNLSRKHVLCLAIVLINTCDGIEVEVDGEVSFNMQLLGLDQKRAVDHKDSDVTRPRIENVTVPAVLECPYQYPDLQQFNAMLSNMMNELTMVYRYILALTTSSSSSAY